MSNQLGELYLSLLDFVEPLRRRLRSPDALEFLFYRYGWSASLDDAAFDRIRNGLTIHSSLQAFLTAAEPLRARLTDGDELTAAEIGELVRSGTALVRALADFGVDDLTGLEEPLGRGEFWQSVAEHVLDDLLEEYLRVHHPGFYLVLRVWGVIRYEPVAPSGPARTPYTRVSIDWGRAVAAVRNPLDALKANYQWGDATRPFAHQEALQALAAVLHALGATSSRVIPALARQPFPLDPARRASKDVSALRAILLQRDSVRDKAFYQLGFEVHPALRAGETRPSGLIVKPVLEGGAEKTLPLGKSFELSWKVAAGLHDAIGFALFPDEADLIGGAASIGTSLAVRTTGTAPRYLLGNARSSRVEVAGFSAGVSLSGSVADSEIEMQAVCAGANGQPGCKVVVLLDGADELVKDTVNRPAIEFAFSPKVVWSSRRGLAFDGKPTLDIQLPLSIGLGPVRLTNATITLGEGADSALACRVGVGVRGELGPVGFALDGLGFVCNLRRYTQTEVRALAPAGEAPALGSLAVDLDFAPPRGLGLSIDAGVVSGGGFLERVPLGDGGVSWRGGLRLSIAEKLEVGAWGIVDSGGSQHWSLLLFLDGRLPVPVPLPLGLKLTAVGGMLALHRRMDTGALGDAARGINGSLDALLFPDRPELHFAQLIPAVDRFFPRSAGHHVFGPMVELIWGLDDQPSGRIRAALLFALGDSKAALYGTVQLGFPSLANDKTARVRANFDALYDQKEKIARFSLTLIEAKVLDSIGLTGGAALFIRWGDKSEFAFTLGGFHNDFRPYIPEGLQEPERLGVHWSPKSFISLDLQAYFALTSCSLQVGAAVFGRVGADWGYAEGNFEFDLIVMTEPAFHFDCEVRGQVTVAVFGCDLISAGLRASLSGPHRWKFEGTVYWEVCGVDLSKDFGPYYWGSEGDLPAKQEQAGSILSTALGEAGSWSLRRVRRLPVTLRSGSESVLDPRDQIEVRQTRLPLGTRVEKHDRNTLSDEGTWKLGVKPGGLQKLGDITDAFPTKRYLKKPPKEEPFRGGLACGARFGRAEWQVPAEAIGESADATEDIVLDSLPQPPVRIRLPIVTGLVNALPLATPTGAVDRGWSRFQPKVEVRR